MNTKLIFIPLFTLIGVIDAPPLWAQTPTTTTSQAGHVSVPIDSTYKLVFDDEFNESSVNQSRWNVLSSSGMGGGWAQDQFTPANAVVSGGFLALSTSQGSSSGRKYSAGFIFTKAGFSYGYWEARAKMPGGGVGLWPAFWMNNFGSFPEIDVFEWLGNNPYQQWQTYHPPNDASLTGGNGLGTTFTGTNYELGFHVYGMFWQPKFIAWYIDGVKVFQLNQGQTYKSYPVQITNIPMSTIFNSSVGGWNNNLVNGTTEWPAYFMVDYLHIYSNSPTAVAVTPDPGYGGAGDAVGSSAH